MRNESALAPEFAVPANRTLEQIEKMVIVQALKCANGNKAEAAQMLGLYRPTLYSKMKKYRLDEIKRRSGESSASPDSGIDEPRRVDATV